MSEQEAKTPEQRLDDVIADWKAGIVHAAAAERKYREVKSQKWVEMKVLPEFQKAVSPEKQAWVDAETAELREARDIAEGMLRVYGEECRNIRQVMSLRQSEMKAQGGGLE